MLVGFSGSAGVSDSTKAEAFVLLANVKALKCLAIGATILDGDQIQFYCELGRRKGFEPLAFEISDRFHDMNLSFSLVPKSQNKLVDRLAKGR